MQKKIKEETEHIKRQHGMQESNKIYQAYKLERLVSHKLIDDAQIQTMQMIWIATTSNTISNTAVTFHETYFLKSKVSHRGRLNVDHFIFSLNFIMTFIIVIYNQNLFRFVNKQCLLLSSVIIYKYFFFKFRISCI